MFDSEYVTSEIYRALVVTGAEGATAPVNFEKGVHAPVNFQPFLSLSFFLNFILISKFYSESLTFMTEMFLPLSH